MNCKQGDLAIVVGSQYTPELIGSIVLVVRKAMSCEQYLPGHSVCDFSGDVWIVSGEGRLLAMRCMAGNLYHLPIRPILDCYLRPIRDQDGQDETLTWLDVPSKEIA